LQFILTIITVPPSLRYLERLWGTVETVKFILVCITIPNLIAVIFNWLEFAVTRNADLFLYVGLWLLVSSFLMSYLISYGMQYRGQMALQIAVLVSFTQLIPEHQVQVLGVLKARVKVSVTLDIPDLNSTEM